MYEPTPLMPTTNSAVTHTSSAIAALTRMPVAMLGSAAGNVTRKSLPVLTHTRRPGDVVKHAVHAAHAVERVDEDRPDCGVRHHETNCGDAEPEEEDREWDERDTPGSGAGTRSRPTCASSNVRELPMRRPAATPITIARASPSKYAERVSPNSPDSEPAHSSSTSARNVAEGLAMLVS